MQAIHTVCGEPIRWALTLIKFPLLSHDPKQGGDGGGVRGLIICSINNPSAAGAFFGYVFFLSAVWLCCTCDRGWHFQYWTISGWPMTSRTKQASNLVIKRVGSPWTKSCFHRLQPCSCVEAPLFTFYMLFHFLVRMWCRTSSLVL